MARLRRAFHDAGNPKALWPGWQPADPTHHCQWRNVACDSNQRVTRL